MYEFQWKMNQVLWTWDVGSNVRTIWRVDSSHCLASERVLYYWGEKERKSMAPCWRLAESAELVSRERRRDVQVLRLSDVLKMMFGTFPLENPGIQILKNEKSNLNANLIEFRWFTEFISSFISVLPSNTVFLQKFKYNAHWQKFENDSIAKRWRCLRRNVEPSSANFFFKKIIDPIRTVNFHQQVSNWKGI